MNVLREFGVREAFWFGVAALLLAILIYLADLNAFLDALRRADPRYFAVAVAVGFSSLLVWAWVWHRFFGQMGMASTPSRTVRMFMTGHFLNSITPLGQFGGEPVMAYIVSENTETDYERSLACVVSADLINAVPFFTFTLGGVVYLAVWGTLSGFLEDVAAAAVAVLLLGGAVAYLLWSESGALGNAVVRIVDAADRRFDRGDALFESLRERVRNVESSFQAAGSDRRFLATTAAGSHLAILAQIVSLYFVLLSLGLKPAFVPLYFIVNLSVIATVSPTPGGSGTYEAAFSGLVTVFYSVDLSVALTAAVLFRLTTYWPGLLVGYVSMLTLRD